MEENSKPKHPTLDSIFKSAIEKANEADIDEPPLVWPELPDDLKTDSPPEKKTGVKEPDYEEGDGKEG